jgi:hypothetical protein
MTLNSCTPPCDQLPYTERRYENAGAVDKKPIVVLRPIEQEKDCKLFYVVLVLLVFFLFKENELV